MVIDDDVQPVDAVRTLLESVSYGVPCAYQPEKGIVLARETEPDLILLDLLFAGLLGPNGVELLRQLHQDPIFKDTPVIFLSGVREVLDVPVRLGADETYVPVKVFSENPFKPRELPAEIEKALP